jgi:Tol biopolymer transport system component
VSENQAVKERLDSWKEIATHLGRDVRTVIRWEKKGLPVHRVPGGKRQAVFAYTEEIDAWLVSRDRENHDSDQQASEPPQEPENNLLVSLVDEPAREPQHRGWFVQLFHANKWVLFGTALCLAGLAAVLLVRPQTSAIHSLGLRQLTDDGRNKESLRTDGTTLYFNELEVSHEILVSMPARGGPITRIDTPFSNLKLQDISNDGKKLLVMPFEGIEEEKQIWIVPTQGGVPFRVGDALCHEARWSPDGSRIACTSGTTVRLLNSDGSGLHTLGSFSSSASALAWSPGGNRLRFALAENQGTGAPWEMEIHKDGTAGGAAPSMFPPGQDCCGNWAWSRNDRNFVYTKRQTDGRWSFFVKPYGQRLAPETELVKIGTVATIAPGKTDNLVYLLVQNAYRGGLLKADLQHNTFQTLFPGLSAEFLSFSRDGHWMTYVDTVDRSFWRSRVDGTEAIQLVKAPMDVQFSAWSPDGHRIAFMGKQPGKPWRIFLINPDGGTPAEVADGDDGQGAPTWSADGKALVYANVLCQETQSCWVWRVDLASTRAEKLPGSHGLRTARWSPDGKYIAAIQPETHALMLFNVETQHWGTLADSITGDNPNWSSDSRYIYADSPQGEHSMIERLRVSDGQRVKVVDLAAFRKVPGGVGFWFGLTPDNSPILVQGLSASEIYSLEWTDH